MTRAHAEAPLLRRVLIANRGEIAIRIAKAATGLGMESVGVFATIDSLALHTRFTTLAVELGGKVPVAAYLDGEALVRAAALHGCDCVHPGYGFLAENAEFAELCAAEGLVFVGPRPATLRLFGDKVRARAFAESIGIAVVPGSAGPVASAEEARAIAQDLGYPMMLKASAGGGGRGMRRVDAPAEMAEAFERCRGEAEASFGDGSVFLERVIDRPRHIEVQVLGDQHGKVVHLHERDCSVQQRNQKVIEIAPAPRLDPKLRDRMLDDAIRLARAAEYVNAGTIEFLVAPETGEHFFIECNPRIQVEHTVTEQVTGVDLVEAQFRIASGSSLQSMGLGDQQAIGPPRAYAVQARVVARGAGSIAAYKEPSGPGVRVDACGYLGYTPPPQFDPLLAKVIGSSNSSATYGSALDRTLRALDEFHVSGLPTNLAQLRAILLDERVRAGDARTTLLVEHPELMNGALEEVSLGGPLALLKSVGEELVSSPAEAGRRQAPPLRLDRGERAVQCPVQGTVVKWSVREGDVVAAGDTILIVSAMKMETAVAAPVAGVVAGVQRIDPGDVVAAGQVVAVIAASAFASDRGGSSPLARARESPWAETLEEISTLQRIAHARFEPGSKDPGVVRQRSRGKLGCRERIAMLLDEGTFREVGSVAGFASYDDEGGIADFTPANHIGGWGKIEGRTAVVCADDFTSRGGHSDGAIGEKSRYLDRLSIELRAPAVRLLDGSSGGGSVATMVPAQRAEGESAARESTGAIKAGRPRVVGTGGSFLPGHLGSTMFAEQLSTLPV
ncbi:MAG TPA: biotin carboxylase N-terminal domain-containing protein, partial [Thermoanaerobaculia bacterium]|nr:biotin carboxylase N-terminal domain-containing protein [Thermoanaerobaculia bacterium]